MAKEIGIEDLPKIDAAHKKHQAPDPMKSCVKLHESVQSVADSLQGPRKWQAQLRTAVVPKGIDLTYEEELAHIRRQNGAGGLIPGLGERYSRDRASLDRYEVYDSEQRPVLARVAELGALLPAWALNGEGVIFYGAVGTGKDHLAAALLHKAVDRGVVCRVVNAQDLFGQFREAIRTEASQEKIINAYVLPHVLLISDPAPAAGSLSDWNVNSVLYRIVNRRYDARKATWATLNAKTAAGAKDSLSLPVFDRMQHRAELIKCEWPSYRARNAAGLRLKKAE
jgi:DNA replication protein DnaC